MILAGSVHSTPPINDGPENGEDKESDPPEPSLCSVGEQHIDQTGWAGAPPAILRWTTEIPASPIKTD